MISKKYRPNIGFVILFSTIILSVMIVHWALKSPYSYEVAAEEEKIGHQLAKTGKNEEALKHFLASAKIKDDNIDRSRRYQWVGNMTSNVNDKIKYLKFAYAYNEKNEEAKNALKNTLGNKKFKMYMSENNSFKYTNRSSDGWSIGKKAQISLNIEKNFKCKFEISYFTNNPSKEMFEVVIKLNNEILETKSIESHKSYYTNFIVEKGIYDIDISINKTFNPKQLRMNQDSRDLGVNFTIKEIGPEIYE